LTENQVRFNEVKSKVDSMILQGLYTEGGPVRLGYKVSVCKMVLASETSGVVLYVIRYYR